MSVLDSHTIVNGLAVYFSPPASSDDPLFVFIHGAGSTVHTFEPLLRKFDTLSTAGLLLYDLRGHGQSEEFSTSIDLSIPSLAADFHTVLDSVSKEYTGTLILVGHSLGGAIAINVVNDLLPSVLGIIVIDAIEVPSELAHIAMTKYLSTRPTRFDSLEEAIKWHIRSGLLHNRSSAEMSVPSLLNQLPSGGYVWRTPIQLTEKYWPQWFNDLSNKFLSARTGKMLVVSSMAKLDKTLIIGQMQGKYQLVSLPHAGHFLHEDVPDKFVSLLTEFYNRNKRLVLPVKK
ncbi:hypothetical protein CANCADRAFT_2367 [Tortispora caseinolytica NRRL Y-17796]|uniref:Protein phosphatase methylesterase 1 n=1 Tax=Tortispora caseinolytica NRRL Y-17796 TaxID=767744 RepID=A0A1E4TFU1_9ASCO|nr:hypothetical protein CANCADRAFT_2367 [Tortispora caseinolytica NRRL Y-17796]